MTMLDRMRRHKGWLKWSLALVVLAFIIFYIPAFLGRGDGGEAALSSDTVATVDGHQISVAEFRRAYQAQMQMYRGAYGGNVSEQMLKQLGLDQQILQQMVDEQASLLEARKQGIDVTDAEVAQRIFAIPAFQENGKFIGQARYAALLRMQRPPMSVEEFEENLRRSLVVDKLRAALTQWVSVTDKDVEREYRRRNEKVKLEMVSFAADKFRPEVTVSDAELVPYFEGRKEQYRIGEKRRIKFLLLDLDAIRAKTQPTSREIERSYNENLELYSTPAQVRASQILLKTAGKNEAEVRTKAEGILKEAKATTDFAALAKKYSEDEASAKNGGDLDYFQKGKMVPEFDEVAFALEPGQVSDLVKTQYGFYIIKVTDKKPGTTRTLDEVRPQIADQLAWERAQAKAADDSAALEKEIRSPADLDKVAAGRGLKVQESGFFTRDEPIMGLGPSPQAAAEAFGLASGQVSGAVRVSRGYAFLTVTGTQAPHVPKLDEVKDRVREDLTKEKAKELARQKALAVSGSLKSAADFTKAAKAAGLEVKTTELVARDAPLPDLGVSQQVDDVAFSLPAGAVSDPIATDNAVAIVRVVEHREPTPSEFAAERDRMKGEMLNERRGRFFSAYMLKAKQRMKIDVNRENLQRVIG
ncbi:MAG TPA: peptidyl-prolyl cis-trans isomerase [Vicinamibacterales bacterium]|jgi:peptidyl-prolyl cis-trans isomerase D